MSKSYLSYRLAEPFTLYWPFSIHMCQIPRPFAPNSVAFIFPHLVLYDVCGGEAMTCPARRNDGS